MFQPQVEFSVDYESARAASCAQQHQMEANLIKFLRDFGARPTLRLYLQNQTGSAGSMDEPPLVVMLPDKRQPRTYRALLGDDAGRLPAAEEAPETTLTQQQMQNPFLRPVLPSRKLEDDE